MDERSAHLRHVHFEALEGLLEVDLADGRLARLGEGEMAVEDRRAERECVHILRARRVHLAPARELRALRLCF